MKDVDVVRLAKEAVRIELEKLHALNIPTVEYDNAAKKIIMRDNEGRIIEAADVIFRDSCSERINKA